MPISFIRERVLQYLVDGIAGREAQNAEKRLAALLVTKWRKEYWRMVLYPHKFVSEYWCVTYVLQCTHIVSQFLRIVSSERNNVTVETVAL